LFLCQFRRALDRASFPDKLPDVKANSKMKATKRAPARKPAKTAKGGKSRQRSGFAPELCGIITGPSDLSLREGFGHG